MTELAKYGEKWARRNGRSPYPVMTTEEICAIPIPDMSAKDALLYLWVTYPKYDDARTVMAAWGFEYITKAFTWVKQNPSGIGWHFGCGFYTHANDEIVIIGKRGKGVTRIDKGVSSLIFYPRGEHSRKPPTARTRIERLHGDVPRIELFARQEFGGWDCWGNEVKCSAGAKLLKPYLAPPYQAVIDEDEFNGLPVIDTVMPPTAYEPGEQMALVW